MSWEQLTKRVCKSTVKERMDRGKSCMRWLVEVKTASNARFLEHKDAKVKCMDESNGGSL